MEKRVLLAALISALFLSWYAQLLTKSTRQTRQHPRAPETGTAPAAISARTESRNMEDLYPLVEENVVTIESESLRLELGTNSGDIRAVTLKTFQDAHKQPLRFGGQAAPILRLQDQERLASFRLTNVSDRSASFEATVKTKKYYIYYELDTVNPLLRIELHDAVQNDITPSTFPVIASSWAKADGLDDRGNQLELIALTENESGKQAHKKLIGSTKSERIVPRGTKILSISERYFCLSIAPESGSLRVTQIPSKPGTTAVVAVPEFEPRQAKQLLTVYFGPRDYFHLKRSRIESAFPIGMLGKLGLVLLAFLNWIAGLTRNYGVAIIVFSVVISVATAPFTLLSVRSMRKMQELKPKIDRVMAQHKSDPSNANREIFALYREHRVSPLSGCLPMLLQMPIFIALFQAISHFIELRGESFLWISDLSLPDRVATLPFSIPLMGNEINALPIIMAGVMYFQTKFSQKNMPTDKSNPAAAMMSGPFMSVMFGVMFYRFQAGLVLYWLTNSLASLVLYRLASAPGRGST